MFLVVTRNFPPDVGGMQILMGGLSESLLNHGPVKVFANEFTDSQKYDKKSSLNTHQLNQFKKIKNSLARYKLSYSLANSNGVYLGNKYHYDVCRVGGILYGLSLHKDLPEKIKPVSSLRSKPE